MVDVHGADEDCRQALCAGAGPHAFFRLPTLEEDRKTSFRLLGPAKGSELPAS